MVKKETLEKYGDAVSRQTAAEMAEGAVRAWERMPLLLQQELQVQEGEQKKTGRAVYIGCCVKGRTIVKKRCFYGGNRQGVRHSAVKEALEILYCQLLVQISVLERV